MCVWGGGGENGRLKGWLRWGEGRKEVGDLSGGGSRDGESGRLNRGGSGGGGAREEEGDFNYIPNITLVTVTS